MSSPEQQSPPLPVGLTLDRGFALLRRHPRALLVPQLVLNIVPLLFALLLVVIGYFLLGDVETEERFVRESTFTGDSELVYRDEWKLTDGQTAILIVLGVIGFVAYAWFLIAAFVSVVRGADRALEGREHLKLKPAMRDALGATPKLFGIGIVFYLLATVVTIVVVLVVVVAALIAPALAVLVGIAAFLALTWAFTRVFLWPFVHLSEGSGLASFRRAWRMTKGRFWALFGVVLLVFLVVSVVYFVVSIALQFIVLGAAELSEEAGIVALIPYVIFSSLFAVVFTAAFIGPLAVAYRTLSGRDTADLWRAAQAMRPDGAGGPDLTKPAPEPGVRRWDASEDPLDPSAAGGQAPAAEGAAGSWGRRPEDVSGGGTAANPEPGDAGSGSGATGGTGGLPDPSAPSDAERRWGRGDDPPSS